MTTLNELFERFLNEKKYLKYVTPKTLDWYTSARGAFTTTVKPGSLGDLTRSVLTEFVVASPQRGLSHVSVNTWSKALNAFLAWLQARGICRSGWRSPGFKPRSVSPHSSQRIN